MCEFSVLPAQCFCEPETAEMKFINVTTKRHGCLNALLAFLTYGRAPQNGKGCLAASTTLPVYREGSTHSRKPDWSSPAAKQEEGGRRREAWSWGCAGPLSGSPAPTHPCASPSPDPALRQGEEATACRGRCMQQEEAESAERRLCL